MIYPITGGTMTRHKSSFRMHRPKGTPHFVLLIVRSPGEFTIAGNHFSVTPPKVILLAPHTPCYYGNPNGEYIDDWLHFQTEDPDASSKLLSISNQPFSSEKIDLLSFCIHHILWEHAYGQPPYSEQNIAALSTLLLNNLIHTFYEEPILRKNPLQTQLQLLHMDIESTLFKQHTIESCAKKLNISASYFQAIYREYFGISFQRDLIRMRINLAKYNLTTTDMSIAQLAEFCGYTTEVHFYRQFKKQTGVTPAHYRKHPF